MCTKRRRGVPRARLRVLAIAFVVAVAAATSAHASKPVVSGDERPVITHIDPASEFAASVLPATTQRRKASAAPGLPARWCGLDGSAAPSAAPEVQVVYAYPSDRRNRARFFANVLQRSASQIDAFIARESGNTKTIRFALGTRCGGGYLNLAIVRLAGRRSDYADPATGYLLVSKVRAEIKAALPVASVPRNYFVYLDQMVDGPMYGQAEGFLGSDSPGPGNPSNSGGQFAYLWGQDGAEASAGDYDSFAPMMLHEIAHTLGAVMWSAPHATGYGHCFDEADVMCYRDAPTTDLISACPQIAGVFTERFDCGKDDYFNPSPAPGSYLATHWNVYDSVFLATCDEQPAACGISAAGPGAPAAASGLGRAARATGGRKRAARARRATKARRRASARH